MNNLTKLATSVLIFSFSTGCSADQAAEYTDDLNGDGKPDVFLEASVDHYYELTDKDFDGRIDESMRYNNAGILVSGKIDENFDGILETRIAALNGIVRLAVVDSDNDQQFDMCFEYTSGVVSRGYRVVESGGTAECNVFRVSFSHGYPMSAEECFARLDIKDFHDQVADESQDCGFQ